MRFLGKIGAAAAAGVVAFAGIGLATEGPALAAPECPANGVCLFEDAGFGGTGVFSQLDEGYPSGVCAVIAPDFVHRTSSIINNTPRNLIFFTEPNCQGASFTLTPFASTGWVGDTFNDTIDSVRI